MSSEVSSLYSGNHSNTIHSYSALPTLCKAAEDSLNNKTGDFQFDENSQGSAKEGKKRRRKTHLWLHRPKQSTEEDSRNGHDQICCLIDNTNRCTNHAGNASYSKRIQKIVQQRKLKLVRDDSVSHIYICDYHKNVIQSVRTKRKRKDSEDDNGSPDGDEDIPEIDFFQMPVNTLRRYKRHFKLPTRPGMNKAQLSDIVARHFKGIPVIEKEALTYFIYMAKNYKSRFDQKHLETVH
ncbi:histone deacetylase complex subunit SAP30L-like isoform X2 [Mytilus californianus]|uniref:SAP30 n=1 Tax=Mytilus coruscus TaxID=42192 RepID=A0A6J8EMF9_MYTCO|nr:histone deacetylase complex subunit SAP30L-like isoform X2 [Mytilus californianus]XP_052077801.1 histone deacetylase complex subunit SAP30L-like isoform X2 [Mytilus californianus]XP_052077802.1 histone deacetylase complex subunit SAP30L-like isoform X2 [Mytilus californianus]CAC5421638.1 SAP30 [Mytilus coruscus]